MIYRSLIAVIALFLALPTLAASPPWTAAGTTAVIDEASVPLYALTPPFIGFSGTAGSGIITAYFNVTDTSAMASPSWNTLEISALDNSSQSYVSASLFRLDKCNGSVTLLCGVTSTDYASPICSRCTFNNPIDFTLYDYYVTVNIYRSNPALAPRLYGVRIY